MGSVIGHCVAGAAGRGWEFGVEQNQLNGNVGTEGSASPHLLAS